MNKLTVSDCHTALRKSQDAVLLDVRTSAEFESYHALGAVNLPIGSFSSQDLTYDKSAEIFVICESGWRSRMAAKDLNNAWYSNVSVVEGGTREWAAAKLPVTEGKSIISLERQVRIAAGVMILTGVGIGHFVHPVGYGLSAFVGAGLIFAGITDTCGLGMLVAKMPWNR